MIKRKTVVRFQDKTLLKGEVADFSPFYRFFHMELMNGDVVTVDIDKIKAIFFVKSFEGNKKHIYKYEDRLFGSGDKVITKFADGETLVGYSLHLDYSPRGFFITPADLKGNNTYVFASRSAIESMSFF